MISSVHKDQYIFEEWLEEAAAQTGDPSSVVANVYAQYTGMAGMGPGEEILATYDAKTGALGLDLVSSQILPMMLEIDPAGPRIIDGCIEAHGLTEISRGVWALEPSLNIPGVLHAFITIYDVPTPAPWVRTVFLATEIPGAMAAAR